MVEQDPCLIFFCASVTLASRLLFFIEIFDILTSIHEKNEISYNNLALRSLRKLDRINPGVSSELQMCCSWIKTEKLKYKWQSQKWKWRVLNWTWKRCKALKALKLVQQIRSSAGTFSWMLCASYSWKWRFCCLKRNLYLSIFHLRYEYVSINARFATMN